MKGAANPYVHVDARLPEMFHSCLWTFSLVWLIEGAAWRSTIVGLAGARPHPFPLMHLKRQATTSCDHLTS